MAQMGIDNNKIVFFNRENLIFNQKASFALPYIKKFCKSVGMGDAGPVSYTHLDTCSMCGKFCAVRSMNKALNGEYIDIL